MTAKAVDRPSAAGRPPAAKRAPKLIPKRGPNVSRRGIISTFGPRRGPNFDFWASLNMKNLVSDGFPDPVGTSHD